MQACDHCVACLIPDQLLIGIGSLNRFSPIGCLANGIDLNDKTFVFSWELFEKVVGIT